MKLFTIGFTQTTAEHFFRRLIDAGVQRVVDVRLSNSSQLAGFAKAQDLAYFLQVLGGIDYRHELLLAPSEDIFTAYKKKKGEWSVFEKRFLDLMEKRRIEEQLDPEIFDQGCLLCSEAKPHHCHRRLIAEYLADRWSQPLNVEHL